MFKRHILLSDTVEIKKISGALNPPQIYFPVGAIQTPKNLKYKIENLNITVSDLEIIAGSGSLFDTIVLYHRFYMTQDPVQTILNSLPPLHTLTFNGSPYVPGTFQSTDIKDSQTSNYNRVEIKNTDPAIPNNLHLLKINTNTIHESIPFSINNKYTDLDDFYFESTFNDILAFSIFPFLTFTVPSGSLILAFDYSINFDLLQV